MNEETTRLDWAQKEYDRLAPLAHSHHAGGAYIKPFLAAAIELVRAKHAAGIPLVNADGTIIR